jgi:hypothetical protein
MRRVSPNVLRLASVPVGVVVGLRTASLSALGCHIPPIVLLRQSALLPVFAAWECILFGLGAAVVLVLASEAVARLLSQAEARPSALSKCGSNVWRSEQGGGVRRVPGPALGTPRPA